MYISIYAESPGSHALPSAIADLTICGAIPPYNEVLGGKLVAMLMMSPEVVAEYRRRDAGVPNRSLPLRVPGYILEHVACVDFHGVHDLRAGRVLSSRIEHANDLLGGLQVIGCRRRADSS